MANLNHDLIDQYTHTLSHRLRGFWPHRARILEEVRGHLIDATNASHCNEASHEAAQRAAIERFGAAEVVAARFADERLASTLRLNLRWFGLAALALLAANGVDQLFSAGQLFAPGDVPSFARPLASLGWSLELVGLPLGMLAFLLLDGQVRLAAQVWTGAFLASFLGFMGIGWAHALSAMAVSAATNSPTSLLLRMALAMLLFVACGRVFLASDAHSATLRKA